MNSKRWGAGTRGAVMIWVAAGVLCSVFTAGLLLLPKSGGGGKVPDGWTGVSETWRVYSDVCDAPDVAIETETPVFEAKLLDGEFVSGIRMSESNMKEWHLLGERYEPTTKTKSLLFEERWFLGQLKKCNGISVIAIARPYVKNEPILAFEAYKMVNGEPVKMPGSVTFGTSLYEMARRNFLYVAATYFLIGIVTFFSAAFFLNRMTRA